MNYNVYIVHVFENGTIKPCPTKKEICSIFINDCILPGIGLLASFLSFEARKRISAREAMRNPYFDSLGSGVALLKDSEYQFDILHTLLLAFP